MYYYYVEFFTSDLGGRYHIRTDCPLSEIKDGFWVNKDIEITKTSDACYFVMPHMIKHISKYRVDDK